MELKSNSRYNVGDIVIVADRDILVPARVTKVVMTLTSNHECTEEYYDLDFLHETNKKIIAYKNDRRSVKDIYTERIVRNMHLMAIAGLTNSRKLKD